MTKTKTVRLPRATPAEKGVASTGIAAFLDDIAHAGLELHSFMLFRAGAVVAEGFWHPYGPDRMHMLHSATKSWTATAVGVALAEGLFSLDDKVIGFFPDHLPQEISPNLRAMTVRDLLTMRTGHATGISGGEWRGLDSSWIAAFFREEVTEPPGHTFVYNSGSSYILSAIVTKLTGLTVRDYLEPRLIRPLGMGPLQWDISPEGVSTGGNGLMCLTEDLLKFGVVHLQNGQWEGRQILPKTWVREATRNHVEKVVLGRLDGRRYQAPDASQTAERREGYGYQWWMTPHGGYRASGIFGQQCIVLPDRDAVIAMTAGLNQTTPRLMSAIWEHLYPALTDASSDPDTDEALYERLNDLVLLGPVGSLHSQVADAINGQRFAMTANEDGVTAISLDFSADACVFQMTDRRGTHQITAGLGHGIEGDTTMTGHLLHHQYQPPRLRVVAQGAWAASDRFVMIWRFVETAFCDTVTLTFDGDRVSLDRQVNANAGPTARPTLHGQRA